jgi:hypothetical protein
MPTDPGPHILASRMRPLDANEESVLLALLAFARHGRKPSNEQLEEATGLDKWDVNQACMGLRGRGLMGWRNGAMWGPYGISQDGALWAERLERERAAPPPPSPKPPDEQRAR